jgi:hypothetical protein
MEPLLIQYRDNHTMHDDIHVCFEAFSLTADSYWLAAESDILPRDESADKVRHVLIQLLQNWLNALTQATPARPAYLPFDFSDEYTGCFRCTPDGEFIEVVPGFSQWAGYAVSTSNPGDYFFGITDFKSTSAPIRLPKDEFLGRIQDAIANAESQLSGAHQG